MAKKQSGEIDAETLYRVNTALRNCHDASSVCAKLRACGYDTTATESWLDLMRERLEAIKDQFGGKLSGQR